MNAISIFNPIISSGISGFVKFHQCAKHKTTIIDFELEGFKPFAIHGIHIHKYGISSLTNTCDSVCDHYNPHGKLHGSIQLYGEDRHAGDLINNILADKTGKFKFSYEDTLLHVNDIIGRSIVIHSDIDDLGIYRATQKLSATTGNAGKRIACSNIGIFGTC